MVTRSGRSWDEILPKTEDKGPRQYSTCPESGGPDRQKAIEAPPWRSDHRVLAWGIRCQAQDGMATHPHQGAVPFRFRSCLLPSGVCLERRPAFFPGG
jgi:hypothetical protein